MAKNLDFRAKIEIPYYGKDGEDKVATVLVYNVAVYGGLAIGFSLKSLRNALNVLPLGADELIAIQDAAESYYDMTDDEWLHGTALEIQQYTGQKDSMLLPVYEGDTVEICLWGGIDPVSLGYVDSENWYEGKVVWYRSAWAVELTKDYPEREYQKGDCIYLGMAEIEEDIILKNVGGGFKPSVRQEGENDVRQDI